ncbi:hypothetical protein [Burkholderia pseudomallei]|uniref:hypothetical protein n=1 Tax=Burkholderia pseudomallei TaxID=28450 RepID=UPI000F10A528|nr:hypothetical protein [Burkholderia pseudomallei]VBR77897.1 Uncharacterised protein [Burkholderia pseudomallei]
MKFVPGDNTDRALCATISHEYLRCDDALHEFARLRQEMIIRGDDRRLAYTAYNAYARFIHHLYEFNMACAQRDFNDTSFQPKNDDADRLIASHADRAIRNMRRAFNQAAYGQRPFEPLPVLIEFAKDFRIARNTSNGHAKHQRYTLNLSEFFERYHLYLLAMHNSARHMWLQQGDQFPDWGEITAFSVVVKAAPAVPDHDGQPPIA